jgi:hypothetical protein
MKRIIGIVVVVWMLAPAQTRAQDAGRRYDPAPDSSQSRAAIEDILGSLGGNSGTLPTKDEIKGAAATLGTIALQVLIERVVLPAIAGQMGNVLGPVAQPPR